MIQYDYIVHNISEDNQEAYKAIIPAFGAIVYGDNLPELEQGIKLTIDEEVKERKKAKLPIPKPDYETQYSGKILLRLNPALHEKLSLEAKTTGNSLNTYIEKKLV